MTNPAPDTSPGKRKPMRRGIPAVVAAMAMAAGALLVPGTAQAASTVANPGFESGLTG